MKSTGELLRWRAIARAAGISEYIVYDILNERRRVLVDDLERLAPALNVRKPWLAFADGEMRSIDAAIVAIPELPSIPVAEAARVMRVAEPSPTRRVK